MAVEGETPEWIRQILCGFSKYVGIRAVSWAADYMEIEADLTDDMRNPEGLAHGGLIFTLCDVACGLLSRGGKRTAVTQSGNIHYIRPGSGAVLRATARCIREGRRIGLYEAEVFDAGGQLIAKGSFSMFFPEKMESAVPG